MCHCIKMLRCCGHTCPALPAELLCWTPGCSAAERQGNGACWNSQCVDTCCMTSPCSSCTSCFWFFCAFGHPALAFRQYDLAVVWQVDVVFEEVDEIVLQDSELPFIAGRLAEPVQPNLLRMRELLAASKCNVVLVDGVDQVSASSCHFYFPEDAVSSTYFCPCGCLPRCWCCLPCEINWLILRQV